MAWGCGPPGLGVRYLVSLGCGACVIGVDLVDLGPLMDCSANQVVLSPTVRIVIFELNQNSGRRGKKLCTDRQGLAEPLRLAEQGVL
jgi:hypothetical protein